MSVISDADKDFVWNSFNIRCPSNVNIVSQKHLRRLWKYDLWALRIATSAVAHIQSDAD